MGTFKCSIIWETMIAIDHNQVALERHGERDLWVHRKGAMSAQQGQRGVLPGSMGGFCQEKDGYLAIAKFPRKDDEINTVVWEAVALSPAQKSGIPVPKSRVENIAGKPDSPPATPRRRTAYPVPLRDEHALPVEAARAPRAQVIRAR
jgi:hypothetical protein